MNTRRCCVVALLCFFTAGLRAQVGPALVRHGPSIQGTVNGSLQVMTGESTTFNSGANISGNLLVPGTPSIVINGSPTYGGTQVGTGSTSPSGYALTLNSGATLGHIVTRTNAVSLPAVSAPPAPGGTRSVTISSPGGSPGSFSTLRDLTLNANVGQYVIPAGNYGNFSANTGCGFTLGVAGATTASVYNFQNLVFNSGSQLQIVGPVVITVANGVASNGVVGASANPSWLKFNIYSGNFTLNSGSYLYGTVNASNANSLVTINANSQLVGSLTCDRLTINAGGLLRPGSVAPNVPPTVSLTAPANNSVFTAPVSITLQATAADSDGTIAKVEFYQGSTLLGQSTTAPYQFNWTNVAAGTYSVTAKATDNSGGSTTSSAITVVSNAAPAVALTAPLNNSAVSAPANIILAATATDSDGTIAKVDFYSGATKIGTSTAAPYQFTWTNVAAGSYAFTAVATDNLGATKTSTAVAVIVNALPALALTSPAPGSSYVAPATISLQANASDSDGTISKVEFFNGPASLGVVTSAPYQLTWTNVPGGGYSLTAVATDNRGGFATSSPVSVVVTTPNVPPSVALTAPSAGSIFTAPGSFTLVAAASDSDGTVTKVEFFQGPTKIGEKTTEPFQLDVSGLAAGSYAFSAKATDNAGSVSTSASRTIIVNAPPVVALTVPAPGTVFAAPASVLLQANASDTDGTIAKVEFFNGSAKLGESTAAPYQYNWTNVPAGNYVVTAKATDDHGAPATSAAVSFFVDTPPSVALTQPTNNSTYDVTASITLAATAADSDGSVAKVEFFEGTNKLGESTSAPYSFTWTAALPGTYTLIARATDDAGIPTTSAAVTVVINAPPTVALTAPANNEAFLPPAVFTLTADAADSDGTITKVEFFQTTLGVTTKLGEATVAPYQFAVTNLASGGYVFTAKATDDAGSVATSASVNVMVDVLPTVAITAPVNNRVYSLGETITLEATAADQDGTIAKVEFFRGATKLGEALAAPYQLVASDLAAGIYALTAKATDNAGATATSEAVTVIVNAPPTVAITAPANNASGTAPAAFTLTAAAADSDGTIIQVEFFNGTASLGVATTAPYQIEWTNVAVGSYSLTAVATDNHGATATSAPIAVQVIAANVPPSVALDMPADGAVYVVGGALTIQASAHDSDGSITKVEYFNDGTLIGESTTTPYQLLVLNLVAGRHTLTAKATDNSGASTTSSPVSVLVDVMPAVALTSPTDGATFVTPTSITLKASASDPDGTITKVEFFHATMKLGESTTPPYELTLPDVHAGTYFFLARATDNDGVSNTTAGVLVHVVDNTAPTVALTAPENNALYTSPAAILLTAAAADSDGTIAKVEFFQGTTLLGESTAAPYQFAVSGLAAGNYVFTAKATDNNGASTTSSAVDVSVNSLPTIALTSPTAGATYIAPASITFAATASDADGSITKVEFFNGTTKLGESTTAPYELALTDLPPGSYSLTARATDNSGGSTTSAAVAVQINTNTAPTVALTAPADNALYTPPATILLTATATDSDGTIAKVEFFQGSTKLGEAVTAPYQFSWTNVVSGTYVLTAQATDNLGATAHSALVTVIVDTPPVANAQNLTTPEGTPLAITLTGSDAEAQSLTFTVSEPTHGALSGTAPNLLYTPAAGYSGPDTFTFKVNDGVVDSTEATIAISLQAVPQGPHITSNPQLTIALLSTATNQTAVNFTPIELKPSDVGSGNADVFTTLPTVNPVLFGFTGSDVRKVNFDVRPNGTPLTQGEILTNQYASIGVTFNSIPVRSDVYQGAASLPFTTFTTGNGARQVYTFSVPVVAAGVVNTSPDHDLFEFYSPDGTRLFSTADTSPSSSSDRFVGARVNDGNLIGSMVLVNTGGDDEMDELIFEVLTDQVLPGHYLYPVHATDPAGLALTYSLRQGPPTMRIDPTTGRLDWLAGGVDAGDHLVTIRVTNTLGLYDEQTFTLTVSVNAPPRVSAGPDLAIRSLSDPLILQGVATDDGVPVGNPFVVKWSLVTGPATPSFSDDTIDKPSVAFSIPGVYTLKLFASDGMEQASDLMEVRAGVVGAEPPSDIAVWWSANGHPLESIHGNHDVLLTNGATYGPGKVSQAFNFDGSSGTAKVAGHADLDIGASAQGLTIEFWVRSDRVNGGIDYPLVAWRKGNTDGTYVRVTNNGQDPYFAFVDTTGNTRVLNSGSALAGEQGNWVHLAFTYDRVTGVARTYKNGVIRDQTNWGGGLIARTDASYDLLFGNRPGDSLFKGALDEITLYNRPLSQTEVQAIYGVGAAGKTPPDDNTVPVVNAGPDLNIASASGTATLNGSVVDDNKPFGPPAIQWSKEDGPGGVAFGDEHAEHTTAIFSAPGVYLLKLTGSDGYTLPVSDLVEVRVGITGAAEPASDIAAWWPGNGHPHELIHGGHDVAFVNGAGYGLGKVSEAFNFDGSSGTAKVAGHADLDIGASAQGLTIEFWVRSDRVNGGIDYPLVAWRKGNTDGTYVRVTNNGQDPYFAFVDSTGNTRVLNSGSALAGEQGNWVHLAFTYDRVTGVARTYKNGVIRDQTNWGSGLIARTDASYDLLFGNRPGDSLFKGALDEITLYNRPLSQTEVQAVYNAGSFGKTPPDDNTPPVVNAGPDQLLASISSAATLNGSVLDDNKPFGLPTAKWSKEDGPGSVDFGNENTDHTTAMFGAPGVYLLKLTGSDGYTQPVSDLVEIRVGVAGSAEPASDIAAWWPGNGHPHELIHGGHDVAFVNGAGYGLGKVSEAFNFDGSSGTAKVAGHADLDIGASAQGLTIEFWVRSDRVNGGIDYPLVAWRKGNTDGTYVRVTNNGQDPYFAFVDSTGNTRVLNSGSALAGEQGNWVHLAFTYDRVTGVARTYKNGVIRDQTNWGSGLIARTDASYDLLFGNRPGDSLFKGALDEITLYNRPLSQTEVQAVYNAGSFGKTPPDDNTPPVVNAGPDMVVASASGTATLNGSLVDDNKPFGPPTAKWSKEDGPGSVTFGNENMAQTTAIFGAPGIYRLRLTGSDNYTQPVSDVVELRVGILDAPPPSPEIAAWWPGNGHPHELIHGGHDVAFVNGAGYGLGKVSEAFNFDGSSGTAKVAGHADLDIGASAQGLTIEFWVRSDRVNGGIDYPLVAWRKGNNDGTYVRVTNNGQDPYFAFVDSTGNTRVLNSGSALAGEQGNWVHLAFTYDRVTGVARTYKNGVIRDQTNWGSGLIARTDASYDLLFGNRPGDSLFKGALDEITLYNRPLSQTEVQAVYNAGSFGKTPPNTNFPPTANAGPDVATTVGVPVSLLGSATDDGRPNPPGALTYLWSKVSGPGGVVFSPPTAASTSATFDAAGTYTLRLTASDSELSGTDDTIVTVAPPVSQPPVIALTAPVDGATLLANSSYALTATASDPDGTVTKVEFFDGTTKLGEDLTAPYRLVVSGGFVAGAHTLTAKATDDTGVTAVSSSAHITVLAVLPNPVAEISNIANASTITEPLSISGIAASQALVGWTLEARLRPANAADNTGWSTVAAGATQVGTPAAGGAPAVADVLGTFDPTRLLNGVYQLRLKAEDVAGRIALSDIYAIVVDGKLKLGKYTEATTDFEIPAPGLPLRIVRSYDSRDSRVGPFGVGTSMPTVDIRVQKTDELGAHWFGWSDNSGISGTPAYYLDPAAPRELTEDGTDPAPRIVTLTLANDEVYRFSARSAPRRQEEAPIHAAQIVFDPLPGTVGTLEPLDGNSELNNDVLIEGLGEVDLFDFGTGGIWDPTRFRLTLLNGVSYIVDERLGVLRQTDANGNWIEYHGDRIVHSSGLELTIVKDANGLITEVRDSTGAKVQYAYDASSRLLTVTDRAGLPTAFTYQGSSSLMTSVKPPAAIRPSVNVWDGLDRFTRRVDANLAATELGYDLPNYEETKTDPLGFVTKYKYDPSGRVLEMTDPQGGVTRYGYDDPRHPFLETKVIDPLGHSKTTQYNIQGRPARVTDALGNPTTYTYNSLGQVTKETDALGFFTENTYDANGNLLTAKDRMGAITQYAYDAKGNVTDVTDPTGEKTHFTFNAQGLPLTEQSIAPGGQVVASRTYAYDIYGNRTRESVTQTDAGGTAHEVVTTTSYDADDHPLITTHFDGTTEIRTYDAAGRLATKTDRLGVTESYTYDPNGRLTRTLFADGTDEKKTYDLKGRLITAVDRRGATTSYVYDKLDRATTVTTPEGDTVTNYDAAGRVLSETGPDATTTAYEYDAVGQPATVTYADGTASTLTYDAVGNLTARTPRVFFEEDISEPHAQIRTFNQLASAPLPEGPAAMRPMAFAPSAASAEEGEEPKRFTFVFDAERRLVELHNPDTSSASIAYDSVGRPLTTTNEQGVTWHYHYQDASAAKRDLIIGPSINSQPYEEKYVYDELGRILMRTDANGRHTSYAYEGDHIQRITYPDSTSDVYTYEGDKLVQIRDRRMQTTAVDTRIPGDDGHARTRVLTQLVNVVSDADPSGYDTTVQTTTEHYDAHDNLVELIEKNSVSGTRRTTYTYDFANRRLLTTFNDGSTTETVYGPGGVVLKVIEAKPGTPARTTTFAYDENRHLQSTTHPSGGISLYHYAADGRLMEMTDPRGEITSYKYNDTLRTVRITDPLGNVTVRTLDVFGHVLTETNARGKTMTNEYDPLGRRTKTIDPLGQNTTYSYDLVGNLLSVKDPLGRLTSFAGYDSNNRPASRTVSDGGVSQTTTFGYDELGNVTAENRPLGRTTTYEYDALSRRTRTKLPTGLTRAVHYDMVGNPVALHEYEETNHGVRRSTFQNFDDRNRLKRRVYPEIPTVIGGAPSYAAEETYAYDGLGRVTSHTDTRGQVTSYTYQDLTDWVKDVTLPGGAKRSLEYDLAGNVTRSVNARSFATTFEYDGLNRLKVRKVNGTRETVFDYDEVGNLTSRRDPNGQTFSMGYDALNRLETRSTLVDTGIFYSEAFEYDAGNRLVTLTTPEGVTRHTYNLLDLPRTTTDPLLHVTTRDYDVLGNLTLLTDARNNITTFGYDLGDRVVQTTTPTGAVQGCVYDKFGRKISETVSGAGTDGTNVSAGQAFETSYTYDVLDHAIASSRLDPSGSTGPLVTRALYDAAGHVLEQRDAAGYATVYEYDLRGRLKVVTNPDGTKVGMTFDDEDNLATRTDERGAIRSYTYTPFNELETLTDALGHVTSFTYDAAGHMTSATDPMHRIFSESYDVGGRLRQSTLPDGTVATNRTYDPRGNLTEVLDADGSDTSYEYDPLNRLIKARSSLDAAAAAEALYSYDAVGNLSTITDPLGRVTTYNYNGDNRRSRVFLPRSGATPHEELRYDARGLVTQRTDAAGFVTNHSYDAFGRLAQVRPDSRRGEPNISFVYDLRGLRQQMLDGQGTTFYSYDERARLTGKTTPYAGRLDYQYDPAGNLTKLSTTGSDAIRTSYTYDLEGRLTHVTDGGSGSVDYDRDDAGRIRSVTSSNGLTLSRSYDANGRSISESTKAGSTPVFSSALTLSAAGQVLRHDELDGRSVGYSYDKSHRLLKEEASGAGPVGALNYTLDVAGNRTVRSGFLGALADQSFVYDENNALAGVAYERGNATTTHITQPAGTFAYDYLSRLLARSPTLNPQYTPVSFLYDGDGRRIGKRVFNHVPLRTETTYYLVAEENPTGLDQIVGEYRDGALQRAFSYGENRLFLDAFVDAGLEGGRHQLILDATGHVSALGDNTYGQLGSTLAGSASTPVVIPGLDHVVEVGAGRAHSIALRDDGTVWTWGRNDRGQLGDGTSDPSRTAPAQIAGLANVVAIATHLDHTLALTATGAIYAWGDNTFGQLGDGTTTSHNIPTLISGLVAKGIAAGQTHSLALTLDGDVYAWGGNNHGQLGDGSGLPAQFSPVLVPGVSSAAQISAGAFHSLVLVGDGTLRSFGGNAYGQLGDGSYLDRSLPVAIPALTGVTAIAAGSRHSLALLTDGSIRAWGHNRYGQLGLGNTDTVNQPTVVPGLTGIFEIAAGGRSSAAIAAGGQMYAWGDAAAGSTFSPQTVGEGGSAAVASGGEAAPDLSSYGLGFRKSWYGYDLLGNVRWLADASHAVTDRYTYDAYGNVIARGGATDNPYLYQGERYEAEAGLVHLRARDYDPQIGRFTEIDTFDGFLAKPGSLNRYNYTESNPIGLRDPSGHFAISVTALVYELDQYSSYLKDLADMRASQTTLNVDDWLVTPDKAAMGLRPTIVDRERKLSVQSAPGGAILGSLEADAGAAYDQAQKRTRGLGAGSDIYFLHKPGALYRQSSVEQIVESSWGAIQKLRPQLNTGPIPGSAESNQLSANIRNRWPDVIYHDALLQSSLRSVGLPGQEVEARFTLSVSGRRYTPTSVSITGTALIQLRQAEGGLTRWAVPHAPGAPDIFETSTRATSWDTSEAQVFFKELNSHDAYWETVKNSEIYRDGFGKAFKDAARGLRSLDAYDDSAYGLFTREYFATILDGVGDGLSPAGIEHTFKEGEAHFEAGFTAFGEGRYVNGSLHLVGGAASAVNIGMTLAPLGALEGRLTTLIEGRAGAMTDSAAVRNISKLADAAEVAAARRAYVLGNIAENRAATRNIGEGLARMETRAAEAAERRVATEGAEEQMWLPGGGTWGYSPANPKAYSSVFEFKLDPKFWGKGRDVHFRQGAKALDDYFAANPKTLKFFQDNVHYDIADLVSSSGGRATKIPGWTWEHVHSSQANGVKGLMRLVPEVQHTAGSPWWRTIHPEPGAAGGYSEWAIPAGAPPN